MSSLVIVAIPREDDPVWKISSEKKPHMTILFLGENGDNPKRGKMAEFLLHAANTSLTQFGLDVDRRGTLGDDEADVLFFQDNWEMPRLREFRHQLLQDNNIRSAFDSAEQFEGWTPHLTLGYPKTPAKPTSERIYWVQFDRIALWEGDYEGAEFILKREYAQMEVAMSGITAAGRQFLAHHGIKGMRWGQRNARSAQSVATTSVVNSGLKGKTKIKAKGGQAHPATKDAIEAATHKQKLKKSGAAALTNQELRTLATRMQLEQQVKVLDAQSKSSGKKFIKDTLKETGQNEAKKAVKTGIAKKVAKAGAVAAV